MTTASTAKKPGGARVAVQRFGTFLSGMIMPNIAAFIAWGFITMLFIPAGFFGADSPFGWHWAPVAEIIGGGGDAAERWAAAADPGPRRPDRPSQRAGGDGAVDAGDDPLPDHFLKPRF